MLASTGSRGQGRQGPWTVDGGQIVQVFSSHFVEVWQGSPTSLASAGGERTAKFP